MAHQSAFLFMELLFVCLLIAKLSGFPFLSQLISFQGMLFLFILVSFWLLKYRFEYFFAMALIFLTLSPLLMIFQLPGLEAELMGDYAFGLMAMGVLIWGKQIIRR